MTPEQEQAVRELQRKRDELRAKLSEVIQECIDKNEEIAALQIDCGSLENKCEKLEACCAEMRRLLKKATSNPENRRVRLWWDIGELLNTHDYGQPLLDENNRMRGALAEIGELKEGAGPAARAWAIARKALNPEAK